MVFVNRHRRLFLLSCLLSGLAVVAAVFVWRWFNPRLPAEVMSGLHGVKSWTLYSIDAERTLYTSRESWEHEELFHDFVVIGKMPLDDPQTAIAGVEDINQAGCRDWTKCELLPRHALSGVMASGKRLDLLICYQCGQVLFYIDDVLKGAFFFRGPRPDTWNKLLTARGIRLGE
jgi:hypothetical protein